MIFFFNDPATTEIYTLSLHDALPISSVTWRAWLRSLNRAALARLPHVDMSHHRRRPFFVASKKTRPQRGSAQRRTRGSSDRKSTRLNSSHANISYAVFCLKKKQVNDL